MKKQLDAATNTGTRAQTRTRVMARRLESVERLPESEAPDVLRLPFEEEEKEEGPADG